METKRLKNRELFSIVTHEIKNSLNPVINLSGLLHRDSTGRLTPDENSYLELIERNGRKILNLVEELTFLTRLIDSEKRRSISSVQVREMIDDTMMNMMSLTGDIGCRVSCEIEDACSHIVTESDVFRKILESICRFFLTTCDGNPSVYFCTGFTGKEFTLTSSNQKCGNINSDENHFSNDIVIESGYSRSSAMWLQFGVFYIYHLNGDAWFRRDIDGNAVFSFSIPVSYCSSGEAFSVTSDREITLHKDERDFVMLVIDDDADSIISVNAIIEHEFKGRGKVYHAENGAKGLDLLETTDPDIVLIDITLPDISGYSLVKNVRELVTNKKRALIAFTGIDITDTDRLKKSGFDDIIKKPFNIDSFTLKIRKWADR